MVTPPILANKIISSPSVFAPSALLREARRQKRLEAVDVPTVCILDPDGDLARTLRTAGRTTHFEGWPCYHTELDCFSLGGREVGIVGRVVGSSFAVLVAEELFASGCRLLVSLTSAGQIVPSGSPPYFVIIDRALRDEGTSYRCHSRKCRAIFMFGWPQASTIKFPFSSVLETTPIACHMTARRLSSASSIADVQCS